MKRLKINLINGLSSFSATRSVTFALAVTCLAVGLRSPKDLLAEAAFMSAASPQGQRAFILLEDQDAVDPETKKLLEEEQALLKELESGSEAPKVAQKKKPAADTMIITESAPADEQEAELIRKELASLRTEEADAFYGNKNDQPARVLHTPGKLEQLQKELEETRNRLLVAETEVARLERILEKKHAQQLKQLTSPQQKQQVALPSKPAASNTDYPIATVISDNAVLQSGPDASKSELMKMPRGVRLTVETRQGNWYRVATSSGIRGWISSQHVHFGKDALSVPSDTVSISGYDESVE